MANQIFSLFVMSALAAAALPTSSFAAVLNPIDTTGHDQDIVFEAGLTDGQIGANGEFGSRQFFEAGVFADGLPQTTNITSVLTGNTINFAFHPFAQNNILKFDNAAGPKTLTLAAPAAYTQLAIVHSGGSLAVANEVALLTYTINWAVEFAIVAALGGETQTGDLNVVDWGVVPTLPSGTERLLTADRTTANATTWPVNTDNNTTANRWAIYLSEVTTTRPDLNIESITFGPMSLSNSTTMTIAPLNSGDDAAVFGLAGALAGVVGEPPRINISRNPMTGEITVSWAGAGILQETTNVQNSGTVFTDVPGNPNPYVFTPPPGADQRFFALRQ